ncbi:MAG: hypothetical protein EBT07_18215, partial [Actinobacteria bacterium]|nr:hypothetical protein [Actinomycetota bacterium]
FEARFKDAPRKTILVVPTLRGIVSDLQQFESRNYRYQRTKLLYIYVVVLVKKSRKKSSSRK